MHVGMIRQGTGPGVQDTQDPHQPADVRRVCGELAEGVGRGAAQDIVEILLMTPDARAHLLGHGEDHVNGGDRQEFLTPLFQPGFSLEAMTRGATPVTAGVVDVVVLTTVIALQQLPAPGLGAAVATSVHGAAMAGQEGLAAPVPLVRTIASQDVRHLWHAQAPSRLEIGHEGGEGGVHDIQGRGGEMGRAGGGTRTLVAEQFLNDAQWHPPFQQLGRIGVPLMPSSA